MPAATLRLWTSCSLSSRLAAAYRITVELAVTAGRGDMDAAGFLESLNAVGVQLDIAGVPLALMAATVCVVVIVDAADPVTALLAGTDAVAAAVRGRRLKVKGARADTTAREPVALTAG